MKKRNDQSPAETLFNAAVKSLNEKYRPGTLGFIDTHFPELAGRIGRAFDRLNESWAACACPGAGIDAFKQALRTWYNLNLEAIEIFKRAE